MQSVVSRISTGDVSSDLNAGGTVLNYETPCTYNYKDLFYVHV